MFIGRGQDHPQGNIINKTHALYDRHSFYGYNRSGMVVENGVSTTGNLDKILERAYAMINEGAYLYQYSKFGVELADFQ